MPFDPEDPVSAGKYLQHIENRDTKVIEKLIETGDALMDAYNRILAPGNKVSSHEMKIATLNWTDAKLAADRRNEEVE